MLMNIDSEFKKKVLLKEIEIISDRIKGFDNLSFIIKGWVITLWSAVLIVAYQYSIFDIIFWIDIPGVLLFWYFDALTKKYQRQFVVRDEEIQDFLNKHLSNNKSIVSNQISYYDPLGRIYEKTNKYYKIKKKYLSSFFRCFFTRFVSIFHSILLILTIIILFIFYNLLVIGVIFSCILAITIGYAIYYFTSREITDKKINEKIKKLKEKQIP